MPLLETKGAASAQGFGLTSAVAAANYIEDCFSVWLYTGNGSTQTITNGIDLSGKGGLVWIKDRTVATNNALFDTNNGATKYLQSDSTTNQNTNATTLTAFNSNGFALGNALITNANASAFVSWAFRKQLKFFDVVTYTGNGANRTIAHNLGSVPGCIIIKSTSNVGTNWAVYHRSIANTDYLSLNLTNAVTTNNRYWNNTTPTSTVFSLGDGSEVNASGGTYVAYLFAHDAGGFGASGTDNAISCGSYTGTNAAGNTITLGYEPQYLLIKNASASASWFIYDVMRGLSVGGASSALLANTAGVEGGTSVNVKPSATGFIVDSTGGGLNASGNTYIYIAIRRGPMRTPTTGTSVFGLNARTGTGANATVTGSAGVSDAVLIKNRGSAVGDLFASRLTGTGYLVTSSTAAEVAAGTTILQANPWDVMDGVKVGTTSTITNASGNTYINYLFDRAPGFFDVVCYTGTGSATTFSHNLGVVPELIIVKARDNTGVDWGVGALFTSTNYYQGILNNTDALGTPSYNAFVYFGTSAPTSSVFSLGQVAQTNQVSINYVAYLFATVAGVSKVFSYTGNGSSQTINCGFTGGSRFVMIKRTDSTGDWYVWDSARGIVAGNDPRLSLNSTAAEVTTDDSVDTDSTGFVVNQVAATNVNVNAATYIFLAIA
jgi:hypothetical protein